MKLFKMLVITTLLTMGLTGQSVLADDEREIPIVGLWEGIDPDDGGNHLRSITRNENGTFSLIGRSTYFTLCGGTDHAVITGTGVVENGVFKVNETLTCFNNGRIVGDLDANYVPDRKNGVLTEIRNWNDRPPIIFHPAGPRPEYQMRK